MSARHRYPDSDSNDSSSSDSSSDSSSESSSEGSGGIDSRMTYSCSDWAALAKQEEWGELEEEVNCVLGNNYYVSLKELVLTLLHMCKVGKFPPRSLVTSVMERTASSHGPVPLLHSVCRKGDLYSLKVLLQWMCKKYSNDDAFNLILSNKVSGENAFDALWHGFFDDVVGDSVRLSDIPLHQLKSKFYSILEKSMALAVVGLNKNGMPEHELHRITMTPSPSVATWVALKLYPEQVHMKDKRGNLPLHSASAMTGNHVILALGTKKIKLFGEEDPRPSLKMLLDAYPEAARIPNRNGRFAINLALESYPYWEVEHDERLSKRKEHYRRLGIECPEEFPCLLSLIQDLIKAAPGALQARDTKTHLYPCMLASNCSLSLIYYLIREEPGVISRCVQRTEYERFLEAKVKDIKEERDSLKRERDELLERLEPKSKERRHGKRRKR